MINYYNRLHFIGLLFLVGWIFFCSLFIPAHGLASEHEILIERVANQEGMDPALLKAMVATESGFDPSQVSSKGAVGLMQLMPDTAQRMGVFNPYNPEQNLRGGARYMRYLMGLYPDLHLALAAYNAGPGSVSRYQGIPPFEETKNYISKVMSEYRGQTGTPLSVSKRTIYRLRQEDGTVLITNRLPNPTNEKIKNLFRKSLPSNNNIKVLFRKNSYKSRVAPDILVSNIPENVPLLTASH
ncbi:MAG: lytic transglycosylase domain-containing protein [Magnetococcus sp. DMHC-6]